MFFRPTNTDIGAVEWAITDAIIRLRIWGTDMSRVLPLPPINEWAIGADESCAIQLDDPSGKVSRLHARLIRDHVRWVLRDAGSKNGLLVDGARRAEIALEPCLEIGIGGITLIAESGRSIALRSFLARLLGWRGERTETVDHALRAIRLAATRRIALVVCGEGDLVPMARSIHRHALGADRPFIVCDPRRRAGKATVRSAENHETGLGALAAASGGSLCVRNRRLPRDFSAVLAALRKPSSRVQLIVCANSPQECHSFVAAPIEVPSLADRPGELDRIITEYAEDAIAQLGATRPGFVAADRAWVRTHSATSLPDIEKATLRLVALRASRNLSNAAARLGMAPISLSRWVGRRGLPIDLRR